MVTKETLRKRQAKSVLRGFAKRLRHEQTEFERKFWWKIRNRGIAGCKFKRQYPIGPYIVDFACIEARLIIELDGGQHADQKEYDRIRDTWLTEAGFHLLRFWNADISSNMEGVLERVRLVLSARAPSPQPFTPMGERE